MYSFCPLMRSGLYLKRGLISVNLCRPRYQFVFAGNMGATPIRLLLAAPVTLKWK